MTKEEKIKEAWCEYYENIKSKIDENGWYNYFSLTNEFMKKKLHQFDNLEIEQHEELYLIRPKSLQGIEDNNGWIKIESEDDLPKEDIECYFITKYDKNEFRRGFFCNKSNSFYEKYSYSVIVTTHYQQIEKPKPPIY